MILLGIRLKTVLVIIKMNINIRFMHKQAQKQNGCGKLYIFALAINAQKYVGIC